MVVRQYASLQEVAERWGISVPTVRRYVHNGEIPAVRIGNQIRVDLHEAEGAFFKSAVGA